MILRKTASRPLDRRGFTLMEVLVVVAILVILAGTASIFVFRYLDDAKKDRARMDIQGLTTASKTYMIRNGGQPPENLGLCLQYIEGGSESNLMDPWNQAYQYEVIDVNGQQTIHIFTQTPDGELIDNIKR
jgi:general secretion pathway protein G